MADLRFRVESARAVPYAVSPMLALRLLVDNELNDEPIVSVSLTCQIRIEPARRNYGAAEKDQLQELFGVPERWGQTVRPMLWTHAHVDIPAFTGQTAVDLPVACTYDFNVAATKYFAGLESGEVPLLLLFSGTVFYERADGALQAGQISWSRECSYRLPVVVWREMIEQYYPNTAWLALRSDAFERLRQFKVDEGLLTWEQAIEALLPAPIGGPRP